MSLLGMVNSAAKGDGIRTRTNVEQNNYMRLTKIRKNNRIKNKLARKARRQNRIRAGR